jgi:CheY-like chemotaxis protein
MAFQSTAERVLVVEDDEPLADLIRIILEGEGYHVVRAATGSEALRELAAQPIHAVLLDLALPDMDGRRMLRSIRASPSTRDLPAVVVSGYVHDVEPGPGTVVLGKPVDITALTDALHLLLRASAAPSSA